MKYTQKNLKFKKKALKKKPFVLLEITEIYILKKRLCYKIKSTDITNVLSSRIEQWGGLKPLGWEDCANEREK